MFGEPRLLAIDSNDSNSSYNPEDINASFISHKLEYLDFQSVKSFLDFSKVPYSFNESSKTIIFKNYSDKNLKLICNTINQLKEIDFLADQVTLKITIFDLNLQKIKNTGFNPSLTFDFSLLSKAGAVLTGDSVSSFKNSLKLLENEGSSKIIQSTNYLISNGKTLDFKKVLNIPFLDENFAFSAQQGTNQSQKFKYKPIGFKVVSTPTIVNDNVYLDFNLSIESVIMQGNLPTTSENSISNKFSVKKGDIVLLAGISKNFNKSTHQGLPVINKIPFISSIFTQKSDDDLVETFNVSIEIQ